MIPSVGRKEKLWVPESSLVGPNSHSMQTPLKAVANRTHCLEMQGEKPCHPHNHLLIKKALNSVFPFVTS